MRSMKLRKMMAPFKVFTPYWRIAEKFYLEKNTFTKQKYLSCSKKISFLKKTQLR